MAEKHLERDVAADSNSLTCKKKKKKEEEKRYNKWKNTDMEKSKGRSGKKEE